MKATNGRGLNGEPVEFAIQGDPVDLQGKLVLPAFIESHAHVLPEGLDLLKLNLRSCASPEDVLQAVREEIPNGDGWLHAVQYDQTKFPGAIHLNRTQLDAISTDRPILLRHSNGHASVANSKALEIAGVTNSTSDPRGGTYVRDESGELTGVLLERAHDHVTNSAPMPTEDEMVEAILRAGEAMARDGIVLATDMMTGRWDLDRELRAYDRAANAGCKVRLRLYVQWSTVLGSQGIGPAAFRERIALINRDEIEISGLKIFSDGAIGAATAAIHGKYATTGKDGQLIYAPSELARRVKLASDEGFNLAVHAIGDRAVDHVLDAFEATGRAQDHRLEHAMILSDAQIARIKALDVPLSMQPEFLTQFGHAYRVQIPELAPMLKRIKSVLAAGIRLTFSSDRPIVKGAPLDGVWSAVVRPDGFDPSEAIDLATALSLYSPGSTDWMVFDQPLESRPKPCMVFRDGVRTA